MNDDIVQGWATVYPHIRYDSPVEAIAWLSRAFGFRERVRMAGPDGSFITAKLETPSGGLVMVAGSSPDFTEWVRQRVPNLHQPPEKPWPYLSHSTTVTVSDVNAHYLQARTAGATILMPPTDHPWALRSYAAIDLEGHQWEFSQVLRIVEPEAWGALRID
ncbi:MAG: VOC family protein [Candidatus Binatus sp.]